MKAGSMEGLIGASNNIKMVEVPMSVYRRQEEKGILPPWRKVKRSVGRKQ